MKILKKYKSHAKVNLGLKIINQRKDGYHNLESFFIELNLHDTITFSKSDNFSLTTNFKDLETDESNIVTKAYKLLYPHKNNRASELSIHLEKKIPMGSGLGGGSSNAATTLKALNILWDCGFTDEQLSSKGTKLGADVPFFIHGGIQHVTGIGEKLKKVKFNYLKKIFFLLIVPKIHISTKWAYKKLNINLQANKNIHKLPSLNLPVSWQMFENDFERVIRSTYPEIDEIKTKLYNFGSIYAGMSGSGSTVFGIFDNRKLLNIAQKQFTNCQSFVTSSHI